jgi:ribonuclease kappa
MPLCGLKFSACCAVLSTWGVLQLAITGLLLYTKSLAFIDDIEVDLNRQGGWTANQLLSALDAGYEQSALNCWIAALLYLATLCVSAQQYWANSQQEDQFKATQF